MARELSRAGNSVVVMEQGPRMAPGAVRARRAQVPPAVGHHQQPGHQSADLPQRPQPKAGVREGRNSADLCARRRRQQRALQRQFLAPARDRLHRAQRARSHRRTRPGRLADHLCRAGALLHQGGMGSRRLGPGRRQSFRSAAQQALSDAAAAGEILRRAVRARRAQARPAPVPGADGDQIGALQGSRRPACSAACATASAAR